MRTEVLEFAPLALHVEDVGPFQGRTQSFWMDNSEGEPCNLYLICGQNGLGKTTLLESIAWLVGLLDADPDAPPPEVPAWLSDHPQARVQLDLRVELRDEDGPVRGLLSLACSQAEGEPRAMVHPWIAADLAPRELAFHARLFHYRPDLRPEWLEVVGGEDEALKARVRGLLRGLRWTIRQAQKNPVGTDLLAPLEDAPAVLVFTSQRELAPRAPTPARTVQQPPEWSHRLVRRFGMEQQWLSSLEALLVYLDYIDEHRFAERGESRYAQVQRLLNEHVFESQKGMPQKRLARVEREHMRAVIEVNTPQPEGAPRRSEHPLDALSSGEKVMAQLMVRIGLHLTRNTLVLIDEADLHLHPRWERSLMWSMKKLARERRGLRFVVVTHSTDMLQMFDVHRAEEGLVKEGYILDDELFRGAEGVGRG